MINASYEKEFVFHDGKRAKNLIELAGILEKLPDIEFSKFVNQYKNDFANWITDVLIDYNLASRMRKVFSKEETLFLIHSTISSSVAESMKLQDVIPDKIHNTIHDRIQDQTERHNMPLLSTSNNLDTSNTIDSSKSDKPRKSIGLIGGIFKKKEHKLTGDILSESKSFEDKKSDEVKPIHIPEPEHKLEHKHETNYTPHETHNVQETPEVHQVHSTAEHHSRKIDDNSTESLIWMILYGLVIGLIVILVLYRLVF